MSCRFLFYLFVSKILAQLVCNFRDDIERVTSLRFLLSEVDVLKARLQTAGVSEYKFESWEQADGQAMEDHRNSESDVHFIRRFFFSVEIKRTDVDDRATWLPFFDDSQSFPSQKDPQCSLLFLALPHLRSIPTRLVDHLPSI